MVLTGSSNAHGLRRLAPLHRWQPLSRARQPNQLLGQRTHLMFRYTMVRRVTKNALSDARFACGIDWRQPGVSLGNANGTRKALSLTNQRHQHLVDPVDRSAKALNACGRARMFS
jgi:hypothetical protein